MSHVRENPGQDQIAVQCTTMHSNRKEHSSLMRAKPPNHNECRLSTEAQSDHCYAGCHERQCLRQTGMGSRQHHQCHCCCFRICCCRWKLRCLYLCSCCCCCRRVSVAEVCAQLVRTRHVTKFVPCMLLRLSRELLLLLLAPLPLLELLLRLPPCERC